MKENKQAICSYLLAALQATRECSDVVDLNYVELNEDEQLVEVVYPNESVIRINVSCDSGIAMIRDIVRRL